MQYIAKPQGLSQNNAIKYIPKQCYHFYLGTDKSLFFS